MRRQGGIFLILSGLVAILLALLSDAIGLDIDPGWGRGRILLLMVGIFIGLTGGAVFFWSRLKPLVDRADLWIAQIETSIRSKLAGAMIVTTGSTLLRNALGSPWLAWSLSDRKRRSATAAWLAFILSTLAILWYATAGRMTTWNPYWHAYHNKLADAFLAGQVALLEQPDSSLTALADPYPFENRAGASYL